MGEGSRDGCEGKTVRYSESGGQVQRTVLRVSLLIESGIFVDNLRDIIRISGVIERPAR